MANEKRIKGIFDNLGWEMQLEDEAAFYSYAFQVMSV